MVGAEPGRDGCGGGVGGWGEVVVGEEVFCEFVEDGFDLGPDGGEGGEAVVAATVSAAEAGDVVDVLAEVVAEPCGDGGEGLGVGGLVEPVGESGGALVADECGWVCGAGLAASAGVGVGAGVEVLVGVGAADGAVVLLGGGGGHWGSWVLVGGGS